MGWHAHHVIKGSAFYVPQCHYQVCGLQCVSVLLQCVSVLITVCVSVLIAVCGAFRTSACIPCVHLLHAEALPGVNGFLLPPIRATVDLLSLNSMGPEQYIDMQWYLLHWCAGTVAYMAPECFNPDVGGINYKCDIFSLAMIMW